MQKGNMHNSRYINNSFIKKEVNIGVQGVQTR